jgi:hypothetical protein
MERPIIDSDDLYREMEAESISQVKGELGLAGTRMRTAKISWYETTQEN